MKCADNVGNIVGGQIVSCEAVTDWNRGEDELSEGVNHVRICTGKD